MNIDTFYSLNSIVYAIPFIWLYILNKKVEINNYYIKLLYPVSLGIIYLMLVITGFGFNQYTNELLKFYTLLMLYAQFILRYEYNFKDAVCLSFLLVFINSYYWEFMLHLNFIMFNGLSLNQVIQGFHLVPAYFLYRRIEIKDINRFKRLILYGLVISTLNVLSIDFLSLSLFGFLQYNTRGLVNNITRISCLTILLIIFITQIEIKKKR